MDFGKALKAMTRGYFVSREHWGYNGSDVRIALQIPDECSKMTQPYIYMRKTEADGRLSQFPCDLSCESYLAEDWVIIDGNEEDVNDNTELKDTIAGMTSPDFKERFIAEYQQTLIRFNKLSCIIDNYENLPFTPVCSKELLEKQLKGMKAYLNVLEKRAKLEEIDIWLT